MRPDSLLYFLSQLIVSMVLLLVLGELSSATGAVAFIPRVEIEMKKSLLIAPVTCLFVTMLSFTRYCLRHVDIGFYQVLPLSSKREPDITHPQSCGLRSIEHSRCCGRQAGRHVWI